MLVGDSIVPISGQRRFGCTALGYRRQWVNTTTKLFTTRTDGPHLHVRFFRHPIRQFSFISIVMLFGTFGTLFPRFTMTYFLPNNTFNDTMRFRIRLRFIHWLIGGTMNFQRRVTNINRSRQGVQIGLVRRVRTRHHLGTGTKEGCVFAKRVVRHPNGTTFDIRFFRFNIDFHRHRGTVCLQRFIRNI